MSRLGVLRQAISQEALLRHNAVVTGASVGAGLLGFLMHSVLAHQLRPSDYAAAFSLVSLQGLTVPATGWLGIVMARTMSVALAEGSPGPARALLRRTGLQVMAGGVLVAIALSLLSPPIASLLRVQPGWLVAAALALPFLVALPLVTGALQGAQRFAALSLVLLAQPALRLAAAFILGRAWGGAGVVAGVSLGTAATLLVAAGMVRSDLVGGSNPPAWRSLGGYSVVLIVSGLAQAVLLSTDILLAKALLPPAEAGGYAAIAVLGRAIYWGATSVAIVLFPKVIHRERQGGGAMQLLGPSLLLTALGGGASLVAFTLAARPVIGAFAGSAYLGAAPYLGAYALGMSLLGGATVILAVHQTRSQPAFLVPLVAVAALEPIGILLWHAGIGQVVAVTDASMALLFAGTAVALLVGNRLDNAAMPAAP